MYRVAVVSPFHEEGLNLLRGRADCDVALVTDLTPEGIARGVSGADAITVRTQPLTREILELAPGLKIVSRHGVGYDNVDIAYLNSRKIPLALTVDANYTSVAEHTLMMMLCLAKDATAGDAATREGNFGWRNAGTASDLLGKHVLILGFGRIGQRVATLCLAFGMRVTAYDPFIKASPVQGVDMTEDFRPLLPVADFLSLHLPVTPETRNLLGAREFEACNSKAFIVNCARGGIIDEDALAAALAAGQLRGAGMDVFSREPPDTTHPLFRQPRCLFSPHSAPNTEECAVRMGIQTAQNVLDGLDGTLRPRVVANRKEIGMR